MIDRARRNLPYCAANPCWFDGRVQGRSRVMHRTAQEPHRRCRDRVLVVGYTRADSVDTAAV
jgi:hypothetical protein